MTAGSSFEPTVPHPARRCDYWLGGKDNFAADRESADVVEAAFPTVRLAVQHHRAFIVPAATRRRASSRLHRRDAPPRPGPRPASAAATATRTSSAFWSPRSLSAISTASA